MKALVLALLLPGCVFPALVADVRAAIGKDDFALAERILHQNRGKSGVSSEWMEAHSWLGRGALAQKRYDQADSYAAETRRMCLDALRSQALDADKNLPIALGASIEVQAQVLAAKGSRGEGVSFLKTELQTWFATSIRTRIQKNLHLLSLTGTVPPPLELGVYLGAKPFTLDQLKGKTVLLFFWAHWCPDCKNQAPVIARLRDKFAKRGLVIIGPTQYYGYTAGGQDATPKEEKHYIDRIRREHYAGLPDMSVPVSDENFRLYGASSTPTLVLVNKAGLVQMYHPGKMTYEELAGEMEKVLQ